MNKDTKVLYIKCLNTAIPELVSVMYENQEYSPKLQYLTGVAKDDASYMLCKNEQGYTYLY